MRSRSSGFLSIAIMKVICSRFSRSRYKIARRSSLKLFNAKAQRVLAKAISKRCSKPSNASRPHEAIYSDESAPLTSILSPRGERRRNRSNQLPAATKRERVASPLKQEERGG